MEINGEFVMSFSSSCPISDIGVEISEITDGIYRIAGFVKDYGITFNQFLINDG